MPASRAPRATPTTGERPYHLGDLRRTLLEEGWAATIESGGKDISLREIARRAGVSPTASFHHFRNKEALLVAVAVEGFARLTAALRRSVESIDDPAARLRIVLRTYIEFAIEHPAVFFRMFGPLLSTPNKYPDLRTAALAPGSLSNDEVYAVTAYILAEGNIIDKTTVIDAETLPKVRMPNRDGFIPDPRPELFK